MKKPQHIQPFNLEHARAGAPYCLHDGQDATILKWDARYPNYPLLGTYGSQDHAMGWNIFGISSYGARFNLVMTPLGYIDGKPVFVGDEISNPYGDTVHALPDSRNFENCRWPTPAKQYPVTQMDAFDLHKAYVEARRGVDEGHKAVANAALRHAVDNGYLMLPGVAIKNDDIIKALRRSMKKYDTVVPNDAVVLDAVKSLLVTEPEVEQLRANYKQQSVELGKAERLLESLGYRSAGAGEWTPPAGRCFLGSVNGYHVEGDKASIERVKELIEERGAARDMAVAEAVRDACYVAAMNCDKGHEGTVIRQVHLTTIIAKVQP